MSKATDYTKKILEAFTDSLPIQWEDHTPFIVHHQLDVDHVRNLQSALIDIFKSKLRDDAIYDLELYGRSNSMQTSGVGLADNFNTFVNLGLLLGNRVVLWDTVILSTVFPDDNELSRALLIEVAVDFVLLKDAIENGSVVMLPHPSLWLDRCKSYYRAIEGVDGITPTFIGYLHSRALLDEGFAVHPYTMNKSPSHNGKQQDVKSAINLIGEKQSRPDKSQLTAEDLIFDAEFVFLKEIESRQLSIFLERNSAWKNELNESLVIPDYVSTQADLQEHISKVKNKIKRGITKQNDSVKELTNEKLRGGRELISSYSGLVASTIGIAASSPQIGNSLGAFGAGIGVFGAGVSTYSAFLALSKVTGKPKADTLSFYQGFTVIEDMHEANNELKRMQQAAPFS